MISSKFRILRIIPLVMVIITLLFFFFQENSPAFSVNIPFWIRILLIVFVVFLLLIFLIGDFKTVLVKVKIYDDYFVKSEFLGFGIKTTLYFKEIDGYNLVKLTIRGGGKVENLYLIKGKSRVLKLSEYYHLNYQQMKGELIKKEIRDLGFEKKKFLKELIDTFR